MLHCPVPCPTVMLIFSATYLNMFLGQNWQAFATQPYFDPQGVFIFIVFSVPLLLLSFCLLVCPAPNPVFVAFV